MRSPLRLFLLLLPMAGVFLLPLAAGAADVVVELTDNAFAPSETTITVGDTVTWIWTGDNRHSVRSADPGFGSHGNCGPLQQNNCGGKGTTFAWTFTQSGVFTVRCEVHTLGGMVSTVTVVAPEPTPTPSAPPEPTPEPTATPTASPTPTQTQSERVPTPLPVPTVAEPVVAPSPGPTPTGLETPTTDLEFEPFLPEPEFPSPSAPAEVVVAAPGAVSGVGRGLAATLALGALVTWAVLFTRLILFGDPWESSPESPPLA